ncbi:MAG: hypothetical protein ACRDBO_19800 [Lachnospiraceae bacterium]
MTFLDLGIIPHRYDMTADLVWHFQLDSVGFPFACRDHKTIRSKKQTS